VTETNQVAAEVAATYSNSYLTLAGWLDSTGFRTHGLRAKDPGGHHAGVGEEFLLATRYREADRETEASIQGYFLDPGVCLLAHNGEEDVSGIATFPLPSGVRLRRELGEVLARRRSVREYTGDHLDLGQLATLLRAAGAVTATGHVDLVQGGERAIAFRTAPSPGGLYPVETWLLPLEVDGLPDSVWRYDARRDELVSVAAADRIAPALKSFAVPEDMISLSRAAAVLVLVGRPWKVMRKYGDRGIRYLFIEAGAIAENIHLAAGALGLGTVDCASVRDDEMHSALGLDGESSLLVHTVIVGVPA
jgi:SagB-type dehydrogenase family enzyme